MPAISVLAFGMQSIRIFQLVLVIALCSSALGQLQGTVAGHVYCTDSRTPCRFAGVVIQTAPELVDGKPAKLSAPWHSYSAITDIDGAYTISGVEAGTYYIIGRLQGYVAPYDLAVNLYAGDPALINQATEIALARVKVDASRTAVSDLTLERGATIGGSLRYDDGSPGINLPIHFFRKDQQGSWKPYTNTAGGGTLAPLGLELHSDDRGEFHEPGLPPGIYAIEATLPQVTFAPSSITGRVSLNLVIANGSALKIYSGDKLRLPEAVPVILREGEQKLDLEITIPTRGLHMIHGVVTSLPEHLLAGGIVSLLDPADKAPLRKADIQSDGSFVMMYVPTGSYLISVEAVPPRVGAKELSTLLPRVETILVDHDLPNLTYVLSSSK
ncbi:MAG: carboxypeptidase-like regulatory domain-containing protein [Janthinobacterium lividum]